MSCKAYMHTGGGGGPDKFSNKNAKNMQKVTPSISGQPQVPPSEEFGQNPKDTPPPGFPSYVHL
jgi:hypothetical protein